MSLINAKEFAVPWLLVISSLVFLAAGIRESPSNLSSLEGYDPIWSLLDEQQPLEPSINDMWINR